MIQAVAVLLMVAPHVVRHAHGQGPTSTWEEKVDSIDTLIRAAFPGNVNRGTVHVRETVDLTGDGKEEALVSFGVGGAYTEWLLLVRLENNEPVLAKYRRQDRSEAIAEFARGASVKNGITVEFHEGHHAVSSLEYSVSDELEIRTCGGKTYRWNETTELFEFDADLTAEIAAAYCRAEAEKLRAYR